MLIGSFLYVKLNNKTSENRAVTLPYLAGYWCILRPITDVHLVGRIMEACSRIMTLRRARNATEILRQVKQLQISNSTIIFSTLNIV